MMVNDEKSLILVVKSPAGILFKRSGLHSIKLDLSDGKLGVRVGHAPMISEIGEGVALIDAGDEVEKVPLHSGIVFVKNDVVTIYTDSIDPTKSSGTNENSQDDTEFDDLYEAIIATLMPDPPRAENVNDS